MMLLRLLCLVPLAVTLPGDLQCLDVCFILVLFMVGGILSMVSAPIGPVGIDNWYSSWQDV